MDDQPLEVKLQNSEFDYYYYYYYFVRVHVAESFYRLLLLVPDASFQKYASLLTSLATYCQSISIDSIRFNSIHSRECVQI